MGEPPKVFSLWNGFVSWSFWLLCPSLLSCKMEKSICVDSELKGRWLCKQNPMLQMCLLNCHMCGVAGQNDVTCWEGLGIYSSVTQFKRRARIQRNSAQLQNCPNITSSVGIIRVMDVLGSPTCMFNGTNNHVNGPSKCTLEDLFVYLWTSIIVMIMAVATVKGFRTAHDCKV